MNRNTAFKNFVLTFSLLLNIALVILVSYLIGGNELFPAQPDNPDLNSEVLAGQEFDSSLPDTLPSPDADSLEPEQEGEAVVPVDTPETQQSAATTTAATVQQNNTTARPATTTAKATKTAAPTTTTAAPTQPPAGDNDGGFLGAWKKN